MVQPYNGMHRRNQVLRTQSPALRENQVIDVLQADTKELPEYIERIQHFLQIDEPDIPATVLRINDRFQRIGGASMSSTGIEEQEIESRRFWQSLYYWPDE